jgi:hypothetical protein
MVKKDPTCLPVEVFSAQLKKKMAQAQPEKVPA